MAQKQKNAQKLVLSSPRQISIGLKKIQCLRASDSMFYPVTVRALQICMIFNMKSHEQLNIARLASGRVYEQWWCQVFVSEKVKVGVDILSRGPGNDGPNRRAGKCIDACN